MSKENPKRLLGVNFTDDEFHLLNGHARKHKMPVREFVEYMVHCYINSMQKATAGQGEVIAPPRRNYAVSLGVFPKSWRGASQNGALWGML